MILQGIIIKLYSLSTEIQTFECNEWDAEDAQIIKLGLLERHYFIIDNTKYTAFAINNYEKLKEMMLSSGKPFKNWETN